MVKNKPGIDYIGVSTPFICTDGEGKFLLQQRGPACKDGIGIWSFGSGKLEHGEEIESGVLREVYEEYSCRGVILERLPVTNLIWDTDGVKNHWVANPFIILIDAVDVSPKEKGKISQWGWYRLTDLPSPLHFGVTTYLDKYESILRKYTDFRQSIEVSDDLFYARTQLAKIRDQNNIDHEHF